LVSRQKYVKSSFDCIFTCTADDEDALISSSGKSLNTSVIEPHLGQRISPLRIKGMSFCTWSTWAWPKIGVIGGSVGGRGRIVQSLSANRAVFLHPGAFESAKSGQPGVIRVSLVVQVRPHGGQRRPTTAASCANAFEPVEMSSWWLTDWRTCILVMIL